MAGPLRRNKRLECLRAALLGWYETARRDLPWRRTRDPYAIWISEIMLQQTQVATVEGYYARWMEQFPTVEALVAAEQAAVLRVWQGLGYYSRARNLHRAAQVVVSEHGGQLPRTAEGLQQLPGIGRYTAGAIASIAFGLHEPVLDGNVARVLSRVCLITTPIKKPETQKQLWSLAGQLVAAGRAGEMNQSLMELGALVCRPRQPDCPTCPARPCCLAAEKGRQGELPAKSPRAAVPHYDVALAVIVHEGRVLVDRRPESAMLGGMWEFPGGKMREGETAEACAVREAEEELGTTVRVERPLCTTRQQYTHLHVTLHAFLCRWQAGGPEARACTEFRWASAAELEELAFPRGSQKIIRALLASGFGRS